MAVAFVAIIGNLVGDSDGVVVVPTAFKPCFVLDRMSLLLATVDSRTLRLAFCT